jgi:hypothetical protein
MLADAGHPPEHLSIAVALPVPRCEGLDEIEQGDQMGGRALGIDLVGLGKC